MNNDTYSFGQRDSSIMDPVNDSPEPHRTKQYNNAQSRRRVPGPAGNYNSTHDGDVNSLRSMISGTSIMSRISSPTSFASVPTSADTAPTLRTSLGSSSSARSTAFSDNRQETAVATASKQSNSASTKTAMHCVCCWSKPIKDLTKHYPICKYIRADCAFWACPYTFDILRDREAFTNHIKSFKPDEKRVAVTQTIYVTARDWAMEFSEDAKKRQLVNTVFAYFDANPRLVDQWKALNNGELVPDLNNVADVSKILEESSILRQLPHSGSGHSVGEVSIAQLRQVFQAGTKAGAKIQTQPDITSKKRGRNNTPVPYTALEIVDKDGQVTIGDAHFDGAEFAEHRQQQLGGQDEERSFRFGGVVVHSPSDTGDLAPANLAATTQIPGTFEGPFQGTYAVANNAAEAHYGLQDFLMDHSGFELPTPVPQTLQQTQSADLPATANDPSNATDDYDLDPDFWNSLLDNPDFSV